MITEEDKKIIENLKKYIEDQVNITDKLDWEKILWIETLTKLVHNLTIAPLSYRNCSEEDTKNRYFTANCEKCGWWGSSRLLIGGGAIADTGDFDDCTCPVCDNNDIDEKID